MSNVPSVNLSFLSANKSASAVALLRLAELANGPLRLQKKVENDVTVNYLGVRSWSTYFFEKLIATPAQITKAKLKTQNAINRDVRSFLHNSKLTMGSDPESIVAALQSKVVGKSVSPEPVSKGGTNDHSGTGANHRDPEVLQTTGKLFLGTGTVPSGLSVAVVSPLRIIADVRLVNEATFNLHPAGDIRRGLTYSLGVTPPEDMKMGVDDFKKFYLDKLNGLTASVQTSVVMELYRDSGIACSAGNMEGARAAVKEFTGFKKLHGRHVSVMLTVPALPSVEQDDLSSVKEIDTSPTIAPRFAKKVDTSPTLVSRQVLVPTSDGESSSEE